MDALRDSNKVPSMLAADTEGKRTIPIKATESGSLMVTGSKRLKEVIRIDLNDSRNKILFDKSFSEITVPLIEGTFKLYLDEPVESRSLTINRALSIETNAEKFYISNDIGEGNAEIWLWE
jgi:hypothetical protein